MPHLSFVQHAILLKELVTNNRKGMNSDTRYSINNSKINCAQLKKLSPEKYTLYVISIYIILENINSFMISENRSVVASTCGGDLRERITKERQDPRVQQQPGTESEELVSQARMS